MSREEPVSDSSPKALFFVDLFSKVASEEKLCGIVTQSAEAVGFIFLFSLLTEDASVVLGGGQEQPAPAAPSEQGALLPSARPGLGRCSTQIPSTHERIIFRLVVS